MAAGGELEVGIGNLEVGIGESEVGSGGAEVGIGESEVGSNGMAPWIETDDCTACDECININPNIFAYNNDKRAYIKDPDAGPYEDLVKAAEKCTAQVIHPGLPADPTGQEKWIKRGEKYN